MSESEILETTYLALTAIIEADGDTSRATGFAPVIDALLTILDGWHRGCTHNAALMAKISALYDQLRPCLETARSLDALAKLDL
jgi:hypothetical protein